MQQCYAQRLALDSSGIGLELRDVKIKSLSRLRLPSNKAQINRIHRINRPWLVVETVVLAAVIILFNILAFDIGLFGFMTSAADPESFIPLKAPTFKDILPWLNLWLITILLMGSNFILDPEWAAQQRAAGISLDEIEQTLLPIINTSLVIAIGIALISLAGASLRKVIFLARSWRLQGRDIDILFQLSLILAGIYVIFAPLAAIRTKATFLDLSVPLGLIAGLIIVKSMIPRRV
jgi:hypothetical protein